MANTPWSYSVTGFQLLGKSHDEIRALCREAGLAGIEGVAPLFAGMSEKELDREGKLYRDDGLKIDSFHLPFAPEDDIASFYKSVRAGAVDTMRTWMERAARLGARVVIQHPTTSRANFRLEGLDPYLSAIDDSLSQLIPWAEETGVIIAIENMLPGPHGRLGADPEHFRIFHDKFAHPHLGFCLDTGHALVAAWEKAGDFLEAMEPGLVAFHLADNPGDRDSHLAPGRGRVDWPSVFRKMRDVGFRDVACIETPPFAFGPDYTVEAWRDLASDTARLASEALGSTAPA